MLENHVPLNNGEIRLGGEGLVNVKRLGTISRRHITTTFSQFESRESRYESRRAIC